MKSTPRPRLPVRVEKELWSDKSRAGLDYEFAPEFYEDKPFSCSACGQPGVFTAEQQKHMYEVEKAYTWAQHVLCASCHGTRVRLRAEADALLAAWLKDKAALARSAHELRRWKEVLEQLTVYGVRRDTARIRMLTRLLAKAP